MRRPFLFILFQLLSLSTIKGQQELIEMPPMEPMSWCELNGYGWVDELKYRSSVVAYSKVVLSEIDMEQPGNSILDSVFYRRAEPTSFFNVVFEMLRQGQVRAYPNFTDSAIPLATVKKIIDSTGYISNARIIITEQWLFDNSRSLTVVKLLSLAFVAKVDDKAYQPVFWVWYPLMKDGLRKYNVVIDEENKMKLNVFLEGRFYKSNVIGELPVKQD